MSGAYLGKSFARRGLSLTENRAKASARCDWPTEPLCHQLLGARALVLSPRLISALMPRPSATAWSARLTSGSFELPPDLAEQRKSWNVVSGQPPEISRRSLSRPNDDLLADAVTRQRCRSPPSCHAPCDEPESRPNNCQLKYRPLDTPAFRRPSAVLRL